LGSPSNDYFTSEISTGGGLELETGWDFWYCLSLYCISFTVFLGGSLSLVIIIKPEGKNQSEDLGVDGRIILE